MFRIPLVGGAALLAEEGAEEGGVHVVDHLRPVLPRRRRWKLNKVSCLRERIWWVSRVRFFAILVLLKWASSEYN
jgi:hypothetical protein